MGSKYFDLHLADAARVHALVRGDEPETVRGLGAEPVSGAPDLRPALEVMARGTFVFLPRGQEHPDGATYARAVERVLAEVSERRWCIEFYPEESESAVWELVFGPCEAPWLTLPVSPWGIPLIGYRSARTCYGLRHRLSARLASGEFDPRFISAASLEELVGALDQGVAGDRGLFTIYQA